MQPTWFRKAERNKNVWVLPWLQQFPSLYQGIVLGLWAHQGTVEESILTFGTDYEHAYAATRFRHKL